MCRSDVAEAWVSTRCGTRTITHVRRSGLALKHPANRPGWTAPSGEEPLHRARKPAASLFVADQAIHVVLDRLHIAGVVAADMVEQPAREQTEQFIGDVLTGLEAQTEVLDPTDEDFMDSLVRPRELVTGLLQQRLLEGEMRQGVIHQAVEHLPHLTATAPARLRLVQRIDHVDDALVLVIDDLNARVQIVLPNQITHFTQPLACRSTAMRALRQGYSTALEWGLTQISE